MEKRTAKILSNLLNGKGITASKTEGDIEPAKWVIGSVEIPKDTKK